MLHRARAEPRAAPDYLVPLARTKAFGANGAVSNISVFPEGVTKMRRELRAFAPDVVHVHEPLVPLIGADACSYPDAPVVGTFHSYSTKPFPNHAASLLGARRKFNQLHARIAVSEAAAWTGRRWFGGDYTVIPNGVDIDGPSSAPKPPHDELRLLFVGRPEERKGLPVLLTAFAALIEHVPARLVVIGTERSELLRHLSDPAAAERIEALGRVDGDRLWRNLHEADLLCAPSLAGESFGMVLTEAFAAGTPVLASHIAGYADVVTDGVDGVLVPPADPQRLAEQLQALSHDRQRLAADGRAGAGLGRPTTPGRGSRQQVEAVYERVQEAPEPATAVESVTRRTGFAPADGSPPKPARRLASLDPEPAVARQPPGCASSSRSRSPACSACCSPSSPPTGSASTTSSRASSAPTRPGCSSPPV